MRKKKNAPATPPFDHRPEESNQKLPARLRKKIWPWEGAKDPKQWAQVQDGETLQVLYDKWLSEQSFPTHRLIRGFGLLLSHYLEAAHYPTKPTEADAGSSYNTLTAQTLAKKIALDWQDPERSIPYDASLVGSWLTGKNLPEGEAWEGLVHYFGGCSRLGN